MAMPGEGGVVKPYAQIRAEHRDARVMRQCLVQRESETDSYTSCSCRLMEVVRVFGRKAQFEGTMLSMVIRNATMVLGSSSGDRRIRRNYWKRNHRSGY
jgi:hypothetical protein